MNSNVSKYQFGNGIGGVIEGTAREDLTQSQELKFHMLVNKTAGGGVNHFPDKYQP